MPSRVPVSMGAKRPRTVVGVVAAALAVASITALIFPLREISPASSNGVLYVVAVLLVAAIWGLRLGIATALASAVAFNFFHLPPTGRLTIAEGENWVALGTFLFAALAASAVAALARSRAREAEQRRAEADLAADLARILLAGPGVELALDEASRRLADALGLSSAQLTLGPADDPRAF